MDPDNYPYKASSSGGLKTSDYSSIALPPALIYVFLILVFGFLGLIVQRIMKLDEEKKKKKEKPARSSKKKE